MKLEAVDWNQVADELQTRVTTFKADVSQGFAKVGKDIVDHFKDDDLSGRKADDTGLNIRSGTLHDSVKSVVEVADDSIAGVVYNTGAKYWEYHQDGAGHNPKRLAFDEYFENQGLAAHADVAHAALVDVFA